MKTEPIGIVILNYKTWEKTLACAESIYQNYSGEFQIVIVDNNSPNDSYNRLTQAFLDKPDVTVVKTERNGGFSYGNNFGFDYIVLHFPKIEHVVITNNDIIFTPNSIDELKNGFDYCDDVCITAPMIYDNDNKRSNAPWKKRQSLSQFIGLKSSSNCIFSWEELATTIPVYMVSGCCFAVSVKKFKKIGKLDDNVFLYMEEGILAYRIAEANYSIVFCPKSHIIHNHGATTGNNNSFVDSELLKSVLYYQKVYERRSYTTLLFLYLIFLGRILIKFLLRKYTGSDPVFKNLKTCIFNFNDSTNKYLK